MMKSLSGGLALVALSAAAALAADLPRRSAAPFYPEPVYAPTSVLSWTGFYAGGTAGYGFGGYDNSIYFGNANGFELGATAGYNFQSGNLVVGVEGDLSWISFTDKKTFVGGVSTKASASPLLTVRGRLGYAMDRVLLYATGGYAGASVRTQLVDPGAPAPYYESSGWRNGYAFGGGMEYAFTPSLSAKAEYLYTSLGAADTFSGVRATRVGLHENMVRVGLNYHF